MIECVQMILYCVATPWANCRPVHRCSIIMLSACTRSSDWPIWIARRISSVVGVVVVVVVVVVVIIDCGSEAVDCVDGRLGGRVGERSIGSVGSLPAPAVAPSACDGGFAESCAKVVVSTSRTMRSRSNWIEVRDNGR